MWILIFILTVAFVLGSALILLRSANMPKLPKNLKSQPYQDDENGGGW